MRFYHTNIKTDDSVSGAVILQYKISDDMMTYALYNREYKSGGINTDVNAALAVASPPHQ